MLVQPPNDTRVRGAGLARKLVVGRSMSARIPLSRLLAEWQSVSPGLHHSCVLAESRAIVLDGLGRAQTINASQDVLHTCLVRDEGGGHILTKEVADRVQVGHIGGGGRCDAIVVAYAARR
jgi:hypothetical protein